MVALLGDNLAHIQYGNLRDAPAIIGARDFKLDHRDGIRGATYDTETTTDTLFLIDNHISAAAPRLRALMHWIALYNARQTLHTDAVIRTDVNTA